MTFRIKRVYESASPSDGKRILVDRLWPRGCMQRTILKSITPWCCSRY